MSTTHEYVICQLCGMNRIKKRTGIEAAKKGYDKSEKDARFDEVPNKDIDTKDADFIIVMEWLGGKIIVDNIRNKQERTRKKMQVEGRCGRGRAPGNPPKVIQRKTLRECFDSGEYDELLIQMRDRAKILYEDINELFESREK